MKKFTLLLFSLVLIALISSSQNKNDLQNKFKQAQEKYLKISQRSDVLNKYSKELATPELLIKSAMATQKLDSTVDRVINSETQLWQNDFKEEYIYDAEMKNTSWILKEWNLTSQSWNTWSKTDLGYDSQKRVNSMLMFDLDSITQALTQDSKILIYYNSEGMQDSSLTYSTKNAGATWILEMKSINHYNASKQLIKTDMWSLDEDSGVFTLSMNTVYTYTASGKIKTSSTNYVMEGDEMLWSKIDYSYDGSDRLASTEHSMLNFMTFALEKTLRDTYQYNATGKVSVETESKWNGTTWVDDNKYESTYNAAGDISVDIYSTWNGTSWVQEDKDEYTYSSTNFSDVAFPAIFYLYGMTDADFSFNKLITAVNYFEMSNGSWVNTQKTTFYYSGGTSTNINEFENSLVNVYPNPASESVKFNWKNNNDALSLQVYQITGARVLEQTVYSGRPFSISHLENGVYVYKLFSGQQNIKTGKLVKK